MIKKIELSDDVFFLMDTKEQSEKTKKTKKQKKAQKREKLTKEERTLQKELEKIAGNMLTDVKFEVIYKNDWSNLPQETVIETVVETKETYEGDFTEFADFIKSNIKDYVVCESCETVVPKYTYKRDFTNKNPAHYLKGLSSRPDFYAGRTASENDISKRHLSYIYENILVNSGYLAGESFIKMVSKLPVLSAESFLASLYKLYENAWKYDKDNLVYHDKEVKKKKGIMKRYKKIMEDELKDDTLTIVSPFMKTHNKKHIVVKLLEETDDTAMYYKFLRMGVL